MILKTSSRFFVILSALTAIADKGIQVRVYKTIEQGSERSPDGPIAPIRVYKTIEGGMEIYPLVTYFVTIKQLIKDRYSKNMEKKRIRYEEK